MLVFHAFGRLHAKREEDLLGLAALVSLGRNGRAVESVGFEEPVQAENCVGDVFLLEWRSQTYLREAAEFAAVRRRCNLPCDLDAADKPLRLDDEPDGDACSGGFRLYSNVGKPARRKEGVNGGCNFFSLEGRSGFDGLSLFEIGRIEQGPGRVLDGFDSLAFVLSRSLWGRLRPQYAGCCGKSQ